MDQIRFEWLTNGERLLVQRLRRGLTQAEAAHLLCVSRNQYGELERDSADGKSDNFDLGEINHLTRREECLILRRRSGWTQEECAEMMGITRYWYNQMELGKSHNETLMKFWEVK